MNKNLASLLYELFGPNGSDAFVHRSQKQRFAAAEELQRHGVVEVTGRGGHQAGLFDIKRTLGQGITVEVPLPTKT